MVGSSLRERWIDLYDRIYICVYGSRDWCVGGAH